MRCCKDIDVDNTYHVMIIIIKLTCKSVFEALLPPSSLILIIIIIIILILINFQGSVCGSIATAATRPSALPAPTLNTESMALSGKNHQENGNNGNGHGNGNGNVTVMEWWECGEWKQGSLSHFKLTCRALALKIKLFKIPERHFFWLIPSSFNIYFYICSFIGTNCARQSVWSTQ